MTHARPLPPRRDDAQRRLKVGDATALPLREISALTSPNGPGGQLQLLAVGDEDFAVVRAEIDDDGHPAETFRYDLFPLLVGSRLARPPAPARPATARAQRSARPAGGT